MAFVDIRLPPGLDGIETVTRMWEIDSEILVVLSSAYSDYSWTEMARRLGRTDRFLILKKPFDNLEVRQLAIAMSEKWQMASSDPLTGLLNRLRIAGTSRARMGTLGSPRLSSVVRKDESGFLQGDQRSTWSSRRRRRFEAVRQVAWQGVSRQRFSRSVRRRRILRGAPRHHGGRRNSWAERIRAGLAAATMSVNRKAVRLTGSFGIAQRQPTTPTPQALLDCAEQALSAAKQMGRNRTVRFTAIARSSFKTAGDCPDFA